MDDVITSRAEVPEMILLRRKATEDKKGIIMARIHDDDIRRLKENISIEQVCRSRGIELKKHGSRDLIGKCPFHEDKKPSFVVSPLKNLFHCMGCDAAGSVIDLVMKLDGLTFREAVDKLIGSTKVKRGSAVAAASASAQGSGGLTEKKMEVSPERARQLFERVITVYEKTFADVPDGRAYLEKRGIMNAGLFGQHRIGFSNGRLKEILPDDGRLKKELYALGVFLDNGRERFDQCVVFPVFDADGNITTLYGRYTQSASNRQSQIENRESEKRHVFLPDRSTGLWNAAAMKLHSEIILVESAVDAMSVMVAGYPNVIGIQGTNGLNETEIAVLKDHGVQSVVLLLDGDEAGKKAAVRLKEKLASLFSCSSILLPDGEDPNSFLQTHGTAKLAETLVRRSLGEVGMYQVAESGPATSTVPARPPCGSGAGGRAGGGDGRTPPHLSGGTDKPQVPPGPFQPGGTAFFIVCGPRRYEIRGLEKGPRKLKVTIRVEHAGKLHVDTLDFYSARHRRQLAVDLCRLFEETPETIEADVAQMTRRCEQLPEGADLPVPTPATQLTPRDREEAERFGTGERLIEAILADFEACGLVGERANKLLSYLAMTSRKMDDPLSVLLLSSSGAGKTALQDTALLFAPDEDVVKLTSLSGKALFYKERLSLKHKVLALEEGDGAEEAGYAIRNLISARELVIESAIKDPATGRLTTMVNRVEGPTAVLMTTTNPETDPETKSRFFVTSIDESKEQTRAILAFQRKRQTLDGLSGQADVDPILKKHRNFQRLLQPLAIVNPYAAQLTYGDDRLQGRRDQPKYLNLIKAVAFLRQMQKSVKTHEKGLAYIEADRQDVRVANELAHEILGHSLDELSRPGRDLLLQLERLVKEPASDQSAEAVSRVTPEFRMRDEGGFTRRRIREFTGWSNYRVHTYLQELVEFEYVMVQTDRLTNGHRYRLLYDGQGKDGKRFVLGLRDAESLENPSNPSAVRVPA